MNASTDGLFSVPKPVIGMLHAPPLPGSPGYAGDLQAIRAHVLNDARSLAEAGVQALMLENFGDVPFFPGAVGPSTVAHLAALAVEIRRTFALPLGINVLRNDGRAALAIAHAAGAQFIRVNILCGARLTDQGLIQGIAHDLLRDRKQLGAEPVRIFADVHVKHSAPLAARPLADEVHDLVQRGGADAVIVSGPATGRPANLDELRIVRAAAGTTPVFVGSGVMAQTLPAFLTLSDGVIVGSSLKVDGKPANPVDPHRVQELMAAWRRCLA